MSVRSVVATQAPVASWAGSAACLGLALAAAAIPSSAGAAVAAAGLVLIGLALLYRAAIGGASVAGLAADAGFVLLVMAAREPGALWAAPAGWADLLRLTPIGSAGLLGCFAIASATAALRLRRHLALREIVALLLVPVMFNGLLALGATALTDRLGRGLLVDAVTAGTLAGVVGRAMLLFAFLEVLVGCLRVLVAGRLSSQWRLHAILAASAVHAAATPLLAVVPELVAHLGGTAGAVLGCATAVLMAAAAQAGLWAVVYVVTGLTIDSIHGAPPIPSNARSHWRTGLGKGALYGGTFMALLLAVAVVVRVPGVPAAAHAQPWIAGLLIGVATFPAVRTIVGSADGTPPFFGRLRAAYRDGRGYGRGAVIGVGAALALQAHLADQDGSTRFVVLFAVGALAYAGVDFVGDVADLLRRRRAVLETWRHYGLGVLLGGIVGGALGWYFDAAQIGVVTAKFFAYTDLDYASTGRAVVPFGTTPLFNKFGAIDLGRVNGGVRLFFDESLAGTINWSIAAPLFSVNYFVLMALLDRSLTPLKRLFSAAGFQGLVEQAVRVLGWGLWMAPVIDSFLRQSPDPSWYNQDGAIRTLVATGAQAVLPAHDFRLWSLTVFTGLMAYDWLRILIWFDHMGLRVATLVNLTFIGGDRVDEAAGRFTGHAGRTRVIPESIRRFATWAPLIIPFYIPRGAEWDAAWSGAARLRDHPADVPAPVWAVVAAYAAAAVAFTAVAILVHRAWHGRAAPSGPRAAGVPQVLVAGREVFGLANGFMRTEITADGRGFSVVEGAARGGDALDITRRLSDSLQVSGPFLIVRDLATDRPWSLGFEPMRVAGPNYGVSQRKPGRVDLRNSTEGVTVTAEVSLAEAACLERCRLTVVNGSDAPKTLVLTSVRELALNTPGVYQRDPDFNALHVETTFLRGLNAIFARNRLLKNSVGGMSHETVFHAVRLVGSSGRLIGYEDSRTRFLGQGGPQRPSGLRAPRHPHDEGALYSFDPAASLSVQVELAPGERAELTFLLGFASDEAAAAAVVAREIGVPPPSESALRAVLYRQRPLVPGALPRAEAWPFHFAAAASLRLTDRTPRPWAHVMSNPLGFGAVASNEGEIHSFMGNARQNALTPFRLESVAATMPGQLVFVVDLDGGEAHTAGFIPHRRSDASYDVIYEPGTAAFHMRRPGLELELTLFVVPDRPCDCRVLTIRNTTDRARRYRVVPFLDMVLDQLPDDSAGRMEAMEDAGTGALLFSNSRNDFHRGWAVAATSLPTPVTETVRTRFIGGPGRDLASAVMVETGVPDGSAADDGRRVAAFAGEVTVAPGAAAEVVVVLGQAATQGDAIALIDLCDPAAARAALAATRAWWAERLGAVQVETGDPAFDRLINVWLPYQVLAAHLWGRTGPNQRGGAYGFRDQLQAVLPFLLLDPPLARRQILLHAAQQFREGDVLKWWHMAPDGRTGLGQRTDASDPHLWLPYVTARYLEATGDRTLLAEEVAYLDAPGLPPGAIDRLVNPSPSRETASVLDHCRRAVDRALARLGSHGLPLVGSGDWNDGMDSVGRGGRGESTWLACLLYDVLVRFGPWLGPNLEADAHRYAEAATRLRAAMDAAWRGDHYVFMYDDAGQPLDRPSITTAAWPALSGVADDGRGIAALEGGLRHLERGNRILLVTPPFDENSDPYPGRIAEYPPGVRENGGQYSHGATWVVDAFMGLADRAKRDGTPEAARHFAARAFACWTEISPLGKTEGEALAVYGLAPHQQPADIYDGPEHGGRGGWSWYTGAAARMLSAAYAILGLRMENGRLVVPDDLFQPKGALQVRRLVAHGVVHTADGMPSLPGRPAEPAETAVP